MFLIAGQTAGPNGLIFFKGTRGDPGGLHRLKNSKICIFQKYISFTLDKTKFFMVPIFTRVQN